MTEFGSANQYVVPTNPCSAPQFEDRASMLRRLISECCRCSTCGYVQAEPNWCHRCRHRVEMPQWAISLLEEREALIEEVDTLREQLDKR